MPVRAGFAGGVGGGSWSAAPHSTARTGGMVAEEERIAKAALAELPDDGVVILDAGTVTERLAAQLPADHGYTVITNSVSVAVVLSARTDITLHMMGGSLHRRAGATLAAPRELADLSVDVAFVVPGGVSFERGLTSGDPAEASGKRAIMNVARTVVLLADHTRIGHDRLSRFAMLDEVDCLVTDTGLDPESATRLSARVPHLLRV